MPKAEAYILRTTVHGPRLCPTTIAQGEELVSKSQAKKLKEGIYDGTVKAGGSMEQKTRRLSAPSKATLSRSKRS